MAEGNEGEEEEGDETRADRRRVRDARRTAELEGRRGTRGREDERTSGGVSAESGQDDGDGDGNGDGAVHWVSKCQNDQGTASD